MDDATAHCFISITSKSEIQETTLRNSCYYDNNYKTRLSMTKYLALRNNYQKKKYDVIWGSMGGVVKAEPPKATPLKKIISLYSRYYAEPSKRVEGCISATWPGQHRSEPSSQRRRAVRDRPCPISTAEKQTTKPSSLLAFSLTTTPTGRLVK